MARLPFERINISPQYNRLSAPTVPNAPQPLNVTNSPGANAQYQTLTSFANSISSLGSALLQRADLEKREEDRLEMIDIKNDIDEATKLIELRFKSNPPTDTEDAISQLDNFLFGNPTPESTQKLANNKINYEDLKREGGLIAAFQQKYKNSRKLNQVLQEFEINQHFLARGLAIQNVHNTNVATTKKNVLRFSGEYLNKSIPELIQEFRSEGTTYNSFLTSLAPEDFRQKTLEDIEKNFNELTKSFSPQLQQNLRNELMPVMMKLADEKQNQFLAYERSLKVDDFNEFTDQLRTNPLLSVTEKLSEYERRVDEGVKERWIAPDKQYDQVAGFQKTLEQDLAASALALNPKEVLQSIEKGFQKGTRKGFVIELNNREEDFELSTFTNKELLSLHNQAESALVKGITESQRKAKSQINILINGAHLFDKGKYPDSVLMTDLEKLIAEVDTGTPESKAQGEAYVAALAAQLETRDKIERIPNSNNTELNVLLKSSKPQERLANGMWNPYFDAQTNAHNRLLKAVQDVKDERHSNGASTYLRSNFGSAADQEITLDLVNKEHIIGSLTEQQSFWGDVSADSKIKYHLQYLDNGRIYALLDSRRIQLLDEDFQKQYEGFYQSINNPDQMNAFITDIANRSEEFSSVIFRELAKPKGAGGIGFNPAYFLITEVDNAEHRNLIFRAIQDQERLNKEDNLGTFITDDKSMREVRAEILNDSVIQNMIHSYVISGPAMNSTKEQLSDSMISLVLYHASLKANSGKGSLKDAIEKTTNLLQSQFINIESNRNSDSGFLGFFKDAPTHIMIPRKKLNNLAGDTNDSDHQNVVASALEDFVRQTNNKSLIDSNWRWIRSPNDDGLILMSMNPNTNQYNIVKDNYNKNYVLSYSEVDEIIAAYQAKNPPTTLLEDLNNNWNAFTSVMTTEEGTLNYKGIAEALGEIVASEGNNPYPNPVIRLAAQILTQQGYTLERIQNTDQNVWESIQAALAEASKRAAQAATEDAKKDYPLDNVSIGSGTPLKNFGAIIDPIVPKETLNAGKKLINNLQGSTTEPVVDQTAPDNATSDNVSTPPVSESEPIKTAKEVVQDNATKASEERIEKQSAATFDPTARIGLFKPDEKDVVKNDQFQLNIKNGQRVFAKTSLMSAEIDEIIAGHLNNNDVIVEVEKLLELKQIIMNEKTNLQLQSKVSALSAFTKYLETSLVRIDEYQKEINRARSDLYNKITTLEAGKRVQDRLGDILN